MNVNEIRSEIGVHSLRFEQALSSDLPPAEVMEIYKTLKDLQYRLTMAELDENDKHARQPDNLVIE